jgi:Cyclic nucleotide-binding domain/HEAT repeats
MAFVSRALRVHRAERRTTALMVTLMFASMGGIAIAESGIDAMFFARFGTDPLPLMYLAQAGATLVAMFALTAVLDRVRHELVYVVSPALLAVLVLSERAVLQTDAGWIYPIMWVTVAFAMLAQATGLWGAAGAIVDTRQAKRLFPIFGAGGILGSVLGGLLTRPLASALGAPNLLLVWAALLAIACVLCRSLLGPSPATGGLIRRRPGATMLGELRKGLAYVRGSRLLVAMAVAAVLFSVLFYSLFLPFATVVTERFPDADRLAGFLGLVWAVITGVAFLTSMLLTNRLFTWFGVAAMVVVLPLLYTASFGILLVTTGFAVLVTLRIGTGIWLQGVASPAWETLVNVVPDDRRDQTRAFLNGGPAQVGTAIAGLVALVGQDILTPRQFAAVGLAAALATLAAALTIRKAYAGALLEVLRAGRPQVFDKGEARTSVPLTMDAETERVVGEAMGSDDVRVRRLAFQLAADSESAELVARIGAGLADPDPTVRATAVAGVDASSGSARAALQRLIDDAEPSVASAASARSLSLDLAGPQATARLDRLLSGGDARVRRTALASLALAPPPVAEVLAEGLLADPEPEVRGTALTCLAIAAPDRALEAAVTARHDPDAGVRIAAGRVMGMAGSLALEHVLSALSDPATEAGVEAARTLRAEPADPRIHEYVRRATVRAEDDRGLAGSVPSNGREETLLRDAFLTRGRRVARSALWATSMLARDPEATQLAIENLDGSSRHVADALEVLDTGSDPRLVRPLLRLWEPSESDPVPGWLERALDDRDRTIHGCAEVIRARTEGGAMASAETVTLVERMLSLREVPLFAQLSPPDLERIAEAAQERGYTDGETIVRQGELGDELHVVLEGTILVVQDHEGTTRELARRSAGDVVGEMSLLTRTERIASLLAHGPVRTLRIGYREFEGVLRERPDVALGLLRVLAQRLADGAAPAADGVSAR